MLLKEYRYTISVSKFLLGVLAPYVLTPRVATCKHYTMEKGRIIHAIEVFHSSGDCASPSRPPPEYVLFEDNNARVDASGPSVERKLPRLPSPLSPSSDLTSVTRNGPLRHKGRSGHPQLL